jgi:hypothetical protein
LLFNFVLKMMYITQIHYEANLHHDYLESHFFLPFNQVKSQSCRCSITKLLKFAILSLFIVNL